jgi:hypothetical protein
LLLASGWTLASEPSPLIAPGREVPTMAYACPMSGVTLGKKTPKYNKTLRAAATAATTSTILGLLSLYSNLLT